MYICAQLAHAIRLVCVRNICHQNMYQMVRGILARCIGPYGTYVPHIVQCHRMVLEVLKNSARVNYATLDDLLQESRDLQSSLFDLTFFCFRKIMKLVKLQ